MTSRSEDQLRNLLGPLESEVMAIVWRHAGGPLTVNDVLDELNDSHARPRAYTTVMSVLVRLARKGLLDRRREGRAYLYWADTDPDGAIRKEASTQARGLLDDYGELAVAGFVDGVADDPEMLAALRRYVDEHGG
jgi:predicted transcriptional regulator